MLEDFRNHNPEPTEQERAWMAVNPVGVVVRLVVLAGIALAIALSASESLNPEPPNAVAISSN
jgi:hypothetical protein